MQGLRTAHGVMCGRVCEGGGGLFVYTRAYKFSIYARSRTSGAAGTVVVPHSVLASSIKARFQMFVKTPKGLSFMCVGARMGSWRECVCVRAQILFTLTASIM